MPFLAVASRLAVRAVKGARFAFTGSETKALDGGSARPRRRLLSGREEKGREDREANDDGAKQQKRPWLCAGAESGIQSERSLVGLRRWLAGRTLRAQVLRGTVTWGGGVARL